MGHSQGGHAAMWAGIEAKTLEPATDLRLKGVTAIAPATDINQIVNSQWDGQVNWVLGPEVIQTYLPAPLSAAELDAIVAKAIADSGATSAREMGKVIGLVKPQVTGRADMGQVSELIKARLA